MYATTPFSDISNDIRYGYTASAASEGSHRFIRITDITDNGLLKQTGVKYVTPDYTSTKKYTVRPGDILIARSGSVGRPHLVTEATKAVFASYLIRFRIDTAKAIPEYVFYFALSPAYKEYVESTGRGGAIKNINAKQLSELPIPLPPLNEQRRIVARIKECMERAEEIEGLRTEAMQDRDYLLESLIEASYQDVEGEKVKLADVCSITSSLVDPREQQYIDLLHIGGGNIEAKTSKLLDLKTVREEKLKSSKFTFDGTMVLYNKIRPYLMKVARPGFSGLCSADMYPLSPDPEKLTRDYLFYLLLSRNFTEYAIAGSNRAGMPKVNRNHLFAFKFTLPSIESQQQITEALDSAVSAVEGLRVDMTESASEAKALRESILRKAFAGEL